VPLWARSSVWDVGDGLGKWWEARGGASAHFPWKEEVRAGGVLVRLIK